jgi:hypothetical protein
MPDRSQPQSWGYPPFGDSEDLDAWLAGYTMVTSPAVDDALTALLAPPSRGELADEPLALAEFRRVSDRRSRPARARSRRPARRPAPSLMWLGTAAALLVVAVFGAATVTGRIPNPIQDIAHVVFASHPSDMPTDQSHKAAHPGPATGPSVASRQLPTPDASSARTGVPRPTTTPAPINRPASRKSPPGRPHRGGSVGSAGSAGAPAGPAGGDGHGGVGQSQAWSASLWSSSALWSAAAQPPPARVNGQGPRRSWHRPSPGRWPPQG